MVFSPERLDRFARHIVLPQVGGAGQFALAEAHVALVGLGSCVLVARAVTIQIIDSSFYLAQGEKRYAHTLELQASRERALAIGAKD